MYIDSSLWLTALPFDTPHVYLNDAVLIITVQRFDTDTESLIYLLDSIESDIGSSNLIASFQGGVGENGNFTKSNTPWATVIPLPNGIDVSELIFAAISGGAIITITIIGKRFFGKENFLEE